MKKIFIIGANGFIGQHLVNYLSQFNYQIYAFIRNNSIPQFTLRKNVHIVYGDVTNIISLKNSIPQYSIIVNLAVEAYHPTLSYLVNVKGIDNIIKVCQSKRINKLIQLSSQATKIKKMGIYGKTKILADGMIINSGLKYVILKPSLVYGEGKKGLFAKIRLLLEKFPIIPIFGFEKIKINPIYINDLIRLIKLIVDDSKVNKVIFEPGSTSYISYQKFYNLLAKKLNKKIYPIHLPVFLGLVIAKFFSFFNNPPIYSDHVLGSSQDSRPNPDPILKKYHYQPLDLHQGLEEIFPQDKVKIGIVGLGKMGLLHASILNTFPNVKITCLIDPNKLIHKTIKSLGLTSPVYSNLQDALTNHKIDALFILTPTYTHFDLIKQALKNNLDIFIEKPVTINKEQIYHLTRIKTNKIIHAGYNLLFIRTFRQVKKIIDEKKYGEINYFKAIFEHSEVLSPKKGWMFEKEKSGGGVLANPGPHLLSVINFFFGRPEKIDRNLVKIYSEEVEDEAFIKLYYENFSGEAFLSWSTKEKLVPYYSFKINFDKATIWVDAKKIIIKTKRKTFQLSEYDLTPLIYPVFNLNPISFGESYFIEDKTFIDKVSSFGKFQEVNSLKNALDIELLREVCYLPKND